MSARKIISLLIALSLCLAPALGLAHATQAPVLTHAPSADAAPCHGVQPPDCHAGDPCAQATGQRLAHSCCATLMGLPPQALLLPLPAGPQGPIAFQLAPPASAWHDGLYRPPCSRS